MTDPRDTTPPPATTTTAAQAYAQRAGDIARLVDVLDMELQRHAQAASADPRNWGFAGDLAAVRSGLVSTVAAISGRDPAEVEAFLAE